MPLRRYRRTSIVTLFLFSTAGALSSFCQQPAANINHLLALAKQEESQGRINDALSSYAVILELNPGNAQAHLNIGILEGRGRDFPGAEDSFHKALQSDPNLAEAHYNLGLTIVAESTKSPDWPRAIAEFKSAIRLRPNYPEAMNMLGTGMIETGNAAGAVGELKSALTFNPNSAEIHFNLGRALENTGETSGAYEEYISAIRLRCGYPEAESALGNLLLNRGNNAGAASHFTAALAHNPDMESAHYGLAKAFKAEGKAREAQVEFGEANVLIQRQADAVMSSHLSNESLDLAKKGDFAAAIQTAKKAVDLEPESAIADYNLGLLLADSGDLHAGILQLRKAISLMPMQVSAYVNMSRMQEKSNDRADAIESLRKAILVGGHDPELEIRLKSLQASNVSVSPPDREMPFPLGAMEDTAVGHFAFATQLSREGDLPGAIGELRRALSIQPDRDDIRYNLAVAYLQNGDSQSAELELRKMLFVSPESIEGHLALGTLLLEGKDNVSAATELRQVLALQPDNREATKMLSQAEGGAKVR